MWMNLRNAKLETISKKKKKLRKQHHARKKEEAQNVVWEGANVRVAQGNIRLAWSSRTADGVLLPTAENMRP